MTRCLFLIALLPAVVSAQPLSLPAFTDSVHTGSKLSTEIVTPTQEGWRVVLDPSPSAARSVAVDREHLYLIRQGQLRAVRLSDRQELWKTLHNVRGPVVASQGLVFATRADGIVVALKAQTGVVQWSTTLRPTGQPIPAGTWANGMTLVGNTLVVNSSRGAWGVQASTGQVRWFREQLDATGPISQVGSVAAWSIASALQPTWIGVDVRRGRKVWQVASGEQVLRREGSSIITSVTTRTDAVRLIQVASGRTVRVKYDLTRALPHEAQRKAARFDQLYVAGDAVCATGNVVGRAVAVCVPRSAGTFDGGDRELLTAMLKPQAYADATSCARAVFPAAGSQVWLLGFAKVTRAVNWPQSNAQIGCFGEIDGQAIVPMGQAVAGVSLVTGQVVWTAPHSGKLNAVLEAPQVIILVSLNEVRVLARQGKLK